VRITSHDFERIAFGDFALSNDGQVEAGSTATKEALHHVIAAESYAQFEARHSGLCHEKLRGADADAIADSDIRLEQPFRGEVLTERAPRKIRPREFSTPVLVVLAGIGVDRLLRATVHGEVGLLIAFEVERGYVYEPFYRVLPY